jgi:hypothetical protein
MNQSATAQAPGHRTRRRTVVDSQVVDRLRHRGVRLPELGIGIAIVLTSIVGSLWWHSRGAGSTHVAVAAREVPLGDVIQPGDIAIVTISSDDELALIAAAEAQTVIGKRALTSIESGTPLARGMFSAVAPLGRTESLVGVVVDASRAPIEIAAGDMVDVIALDRDLTGVDVVSTVVQNAEVWSVSVPVDVLDERSVTLRVPSSSSEGFIGHDELHLARAGS